MTDEEYYNRRLKELKENGDEYYRFLLSIHEC